MMKHITDLTWNAPMCLLRVDINLYFISLHHCFVASFVSKLNKYFTSLQFVLLADGTNISLLGTKFKTKIWW